tara:strand:- start:907 stop:2061 length:1155 start_codon:yes stop_codon:yes gene_type:complete
MNKLNIGYDHYEERTNFYNGAPHKDCDWLEYREYYGLDITEVDVNTCDDFYIFPVNALWAKFELFEEKTFFGNYLSEKVIKDLQSDKCLLHINWVTEAYRFDKYHMDRLYKFLTKNEISPANILISSDNFQFKKDFNNWNKIEPINILELAISEKNIVCTTHYLGFKVIDENNAFDNKLRHSHFLSVARAGHQHRVDLVDFYEKEGYGDDKILWSALWKNKRIDERFHWPNIHKESGLNHGDDEINLNDYKQNPYLHSYVEIVTETIYGTGAIQISDKPFKPILNLQPFIYVTSTGGLKVLKDMGYKTFEPFIDESYDDIEDDVARMKKIQSEIKRICNMDKNKLHDSYYKMKDILIYNRNNFFSNGTTRVIDTLSKYLENNYG